jgi:hypothetical protein
MPSTTTNPTIGVSGGAATGGTSSSTTGSESNTYSAGQTSLQDMLSQMFSQFFLPGLTSGAISPNVQAMQTAGADQINKTSAGVGDRMQKFLAQRGFAKSGTSGKVALQGELGRESALGANASAASALQLQQNNTMLSDALNLAFSKIGQTTTGTANSSGWGTSTGYSTSLGGGGGGNPNYFGPGGGSSSDGGYGDYGNYGDE